METQISSTQNQSTYAASRSQGVLRNTYRLLSATLLFSAITAIISASLNLPHPGILLTLAGYFGLLFLTSRMRNSIHGIYCVFALTGFMGYTLGPMIGVYWSMAPAVVMQSFTATALIFFGLSAFAIRTERDFSFLRTTLFVGILTAFFAALGAIYFEIPALALTVSAICVLLMSGVIVYETNQIVRGGEQNYIMATVSLFVALFNLFSSLLHLLGFFQQE